MCHRTGCERFLREYPGPSPRWDIDPNIASSYWAGCAGCRIRFWKQKPIYVSPARSKWAPPQTNHYVCDNCYSERIRSRREAHPSLKLLPCLCARRQNLELLLVNKRINREAGHVFWAENWFCFERTTYLVDFLSGIRSETRSLITRVSLVINARPEDDIKLTWKMIQPCWASLRQCDGLTDLELDAILLSRFSWVSGWRNVTTRRRVTFVGHDYDMPSDRKRPSPLIWKAIHERSLVRTVLAAALSDSMGRGRPLRKNKVKELWRQKDRKPEGFLVHDDMQTNEDE